MKSKSMKKFLQKSLATALVAAMAIAAAAPLSATNAQAAVKDAAVVTTISDSGKITTANGDTADYASNITFTMRNKDGSYTELSLEDAKAAVKEGKTVKVYTASHKEGYGSAWNSNYTYTDFRTGVQIGEKSEDAIGVEGDGNDKTTEMAVYGGTLYDGYKNTADTVKMVAPPWRLGIVGNSRGTSTVNIGANANIKAASDANAAARGISFPEGYMGPVFSDAEFTEAAGYQKAGQKTEAKDAAKNVLNISDKDLKGNIYNGSGYFGKSGYLTVNLKKGSKITGSISSTTIKHTTDGGKTQNTSTKEADYNEFGHVMNKPYFNGSNKVTVNVNGTWVADGTSYIQSLKIGTNGSIKGTVTVNGKKVTLKPGKSYTGTIVVKAN